MLQTAKESRIGEQIWQTQKKNQKQNKLNFAKWIIFEHSYQQNILSFDI